MGAGLISSRHPVADPFVLLCKVGILAMRSARWRTAWGQRKIVPGDEMLGMQDAEFQQIVRDIYEFQWVAFAHHARTWC